MSATDAVRWHYAREAIVPRLLAALRGARGEAVVPTPETLAPLDQYHRGGLGTTRRMAERLAPRAGERVLDIGSGLGGPARWLAATFGCHVTGVDLVPEYCRAAEEFTALTGMDGQVRFLEGDAAALPLPDAGFDRAFSMSVLMNLPDLGAGCREAFRVLKPGGLLVLFMIGAGPAGAPVFPLPFAAAPEASFLQAPAAIRAALEAAGLEILGFEDVTPAVVPEQRAYLHRLETEGLPSLGWHVLMGETWSREAQANAARGFIDGALVELEIVTRRPDIT